MELATSSVSYLASAPTDEELFSIRCPLEVESPLGGQSSAQEGCDVDWFEQALQTEAPRSRPVSTISTLPIVPVKNSWGDDEEEADEELTEEESGEEEDEPDPFEDFDEEDFDDDFDDDFEEELEDEYEIEPKDDGFAIEEDADDSGSELDDDDEDIAE